MDRVDRETRSRIMASVRSEDTGPEMTVRQMLHKKGARFRVHDKRFIGKPDIVLAGRRMAVFVHGCFWHGHASCVKGRLPKSRVAFWSNKIKTNKTRDAHVESELSIIDWKTIVIWQCQTESLDELSGLIDDLLACKSKTE